jgi:hypothetical protein
MQIPDRRVNVRLSWNFPVTISKDGLDHPFEGTSVNVSQRGALIATKSWPCFKVRDTATVVCYLTGEFTGQKQTVGLEGAAVVRRVDQINEAVAVEFVKNFNQFKPAFKA